MSEIAPEALADWAASVGRTETQVQRLEVESLRRFALAAGDDPDVERRSPPLAHWAFFLPSPADDGIGEDGHPRRGGFLPAITLPRRMFASAEIRFEAPLLLGEEAELTSAVAAVTHKSGRSGELVFVEVDRLIAQAGTPRVRERQHYVYRQDGAPAPLPVPAHLPDGEVWQPEAVNLFRFSAATFNGHRIHYDLPYARDVEGYPALVVHGPFTATRLAGLAARHGALAAFSFRAQAPLFLGQPIVLEGGPEEFNAIRCDGAVAMTANASYR